MVYQRCIGAVSPKYFTEFIVFSVVVLLVVSAILRYYCIFIDHLVQ